MRFKRILCSLPGIAALLLVTPGCEVPGGPPGPVYVDHRGPAVVSTDFELILGDGYAGRGYYYGPRGTHYFRRGPGIAFYRTREAAPRRYWDRNWHEGLRDGHHDGRPDVRPGPPRNDGRPGPRDGRDYPDRRDNPDRRDGPDRPWNR